MTQDELERCEAGRELRDDIEDTTAVIKVLENDKCSEIKIIDCHNKDYSSNLLTDTKKDLKAMLLKRLEEDLEMLNKKFEEL